MMTSRERVMAAVNHQVPDRVPVDLGGHRSSGIMAIAYSKLKKHLAEICFVDQAFVKDQSLTVAKVLESVGKEIGGTMDLVDYLYYRVGEEAE